MSTVTYLVWHNGEPYDRVECPFCHEYDYVHVDVKDNWMCINCGAEYWLTPARLVSSKQPKIVRDPQTGEPIAWQLSLGELSRGNFFHAEDKADS